MGIESRDYIRDNRPTFGFGPVPGDLWAVKYLLIANVVVFLLQQVTRDQFTGWFEMRSPYRSLGEALQVWRLVTCGFFHADFMHILFNMFALWVFGRMIEPIIGSKEFLLFFLVGVVAGSVAQLATTTIADLTTVAPPRYVAGIGASGGVLAVVLLTTMTFPQRKMLLFGVVPMTMTVLAILVVAYNVWGALNRSGDGVGYWAHLGGAAFGAAYKYYEWRFSGLWATLRQRFRRRVHRARTNVKLYRPSEPSPEEMDRKVDEILAKIHENGEASLTDEERKILTDASRQYRKR